MGTSLVWMHRLGLVLFFSFGTLISVGAQDAAVPSLTSPMKDTLGSIQQSIDKGHADEALAAIARLRTQDAAIKGLSRMEGLADYAKGDLRASDAAFASALKENPKDLESFEMRGPRAGAAGAAGGRDPVTRVSKEWAPDEDRPELHPGALLYGCTAVRRCAPGVRGTVWVWGRERGCVSFGRADAIAKGVSPRWRSSLPRRHWSLSRHCRSRMSC